MPGNMECGGKRSATPLLDNLTIDQSIQSAVDASLCRRTPKLTSASRVRPFPGLTIHFGLLTASPPTAY